MMIKNYTSSLSLSDYTVGGAYAFYVNNSNISRLVKADEKTAKKFGLKLSRFINKIIDAKNDGRWLSFTRVIGIVVDKHDAVNRNDIDTITVMFKTGDGNYKLNEYAVGYHDVLTNEKDFVAPAAVLSTAVKEAQLRIKETSFLYAKLSA